MDSAHKFSPISPRLLVPLLLVLPALILSACGDEKKSEDSRTPGQATIKTGPDDWPHFGRDEQRSHFLAGPERLNPPLKQRWSFSDRVLIEFPPAIVDGVAYLADKYGDVRALRLSDQKVLWDIQKDHRNVGPPTDTTAPAFDSGHVFVAFQGGELVSFDAATGKIDWKRNMQTGLQSSPIVVDGRLYLGSEKGILFALDAASGKTEWTFNTPTPIKTSPSVDSGLVYFGDYSGTVYALDAASGKRRWETDTTETAPGGDGGFYSSPAIADGRVYIGRDDGVAYAFDQKTGKQSWFFQTEGDIYGSPAVAAVPGEPLTVYFGSYDSRLYALNAKTGKKEWDYDVGGPVPGTPTVVGHTVYTSSFKTAKSIGIDIRTHKKTFTFDSPGYTPMISDGLNLYLVGYYTLHGFTPE